MDKTSAMSGRKKDKTNPGHQNQQRAKNLGKPLQLGQQKPRESRVLVDGARHTVAGELFKKTSDNVNQPVKKTPLVAKPQPNRKRATIESQNEVVGDGLGQQQNRQNQQDTKSATTTGGSWDRILTGTSKGTSVEQDKSKDASPTQVPPGPPSPSASSSSLTSSVPSSSITRPTSSIVTVHPQPRQPHQPTSSHRQSSTGTSSTTSKSSTGADGINLFRFHPLRTLQFLTLELKSKLKALDASSSSACGSIPELKQLYSITKEVLVAVRVLTDAQKEDQKSTGNCKRCCEKLEALDVNHNMTNSSSLISEKSCAICDQLKDELHRQRVHHSEHTLRLNKEVHYLKTKLQTLSKNSERGKGDNEDDDDDDVSTKQLQPEKCLPPKCSVVPPPTTAADHRLDGEIKRLQTMISDKQTLQDGLIADLNWKLQEAASRCRRHQKARNESEQRLLNALVENTRLKFLLTTQDSTMTNLKSNFSAIETLTHQQIDLLQDGSSRSPHSNPARSTTSATRRGEEEEQHDNKASPNNPISSAIIDNRHCNYRHPSSSGSGSGDDSGSAEIPSSSSDASDTSDCQLGPPGMQSQQHQSSNADTTTTTTSTQEKPDACMVDPAEKLRKQRRRHYGFKNIAAEKESDDGNDANDLPPSSTSSSRPRSLSLSSSSSTTTTTALSPLKTTKTLNDNILDAVAVALLCKHYGKGVKNKGNRSHSKSAPPPMTSTAGASSQEKRLSSSKSMRTTTASTEKEFVRSKTRPVKRTILIDSDCEVSRPEAEQRPTANKDGDEGGQQKYAAVARSPTPEVKKSSSIAAEAWDNALITNDKHGSSKPNNDCASRPDSPTAEPTETTATSKSPAITTTSTTTSTSPIKPSGPGQPNDISSCFSASTSTTKQTQKGQRQRRQKRKRGRKRPKGLW